MKCGSTRPVAILRSASTKRRSSSTGVRRRRRVAEVDVRRRVPGEVVLDPRIGEHPSDRRRDVRVPCAFVGPVQARRHQHDDVFTRHARREQGFDQRPQEQVVRYRPGDVADQDAGGAPSAVRPRQAARNRPARRTPAAPPPRDPGPPASRRLRMSVTSRVVRQLDLEAAATEKELDLQSASWAAPKRRHITPHPARCQSAAALLAPRTRALAHLLRPARSGDRIERARSGCAEETRAAHATPPRRSEVRAAASRGLPRRRFPLSGHWPKARSRYCSMSPSGASTRPASRSRSPAVSTTESPGDAQTRRAQEAAAAPEAPLPRRRARRAPAGERRRQDHLPGAPVPDA